MNYPLISEYIEAIKSAEDNFEELSYLRPVLGDDGLPVMTSGNFAVVFKMKDEQSGKFYAVKCFTKEQEGRAEAYREIENELKDISSPYLVSIRYLEKELFVDTDQTAETEFPVLLMDWVDGKTLDKYLRENLDDKYALEMLAYRFSLLAQWLIPQPFAHGDLKPDNILVREDGTLVLVDYDGMYVPAMKGQKARELGSPDFRHPQRKEDDFDEHIDDFPFVSILLSLKSISIKSQLLEEYGALDRLLFSERDYNTIGESGWMKEQFPTTNATVNKMGALFLLSLTNGINSIGILQLLHRIELDEYLLSTTKEEIADAWKDEKGVRYSHDKKRLLKSPIIDWIKGDYYINTNTKVICNSALCNCWGFEKAVLPQGLIKIGDNAFYTCRSLKHIVIPNTVSDIGKWAFYHCDLLSLDIPDSIKSIGEWAFAGCEELQSVTIGKGLSIIENGAFSGCFSIEEILVPNNIVSIGKNAFSYCKKLRIVYLPATIKRIGEQPFVGCVNLQSIIIPEGYKSFFEMLLPDDKDKLVEDSSERNNLSRNAIASTNNNLKLRVIKEYATIQLVEMNETLKEYNKKNKRQSARVVFVYDDNNSKVKGKRYSIIVDLNRMKIPTGTTDKLLYAKEKLEGERLKFSTFIATVEDLCKGRDFEGATVVNDGKSEMSTQSMSFPDWNTTEDYAMKALKRRFLDRIKRKKLYIGPLPVDGGIDNTNIDYDNLLFD